MVAQFEPKVLDFCPGVPVKLASVEIEEAILGGILLDPDILQGINDLPIAAFTLRNHCLIFNAILEANKAGFKPDAQIVALEMHKVGTLQEVGGKAKLAQLLDRVVYSGNVPQYAQLLREDYQRHCLSSSFKKIAELSETERDLGSVLEQAQEQLAQFESVSVNRKPTIEQAAEQAKDILQAKYPELTENIELEKVREAFGMSSYDWGFCCKNFLRTKDPIGMDLFMQQLRKFSRAYSACARMSPFSVVLRKPGEVIICESQVLIQPNAQALLYSCSHLDLTLIYSFRQSDNLGITDQR